MISKEFLGSTDLLNQDEKRGFLQHLSGNLYVVSSWYITCRHFSSSLDSDTFVDELLYVRPFSRRVATESPNRNIRKSKNLVSETDGFYRSPPQKKKWMVMFTD